MSEVATARPLIWIPREVHPDAIGELETWAEVRRGWGEDAATEADIAPLAQGVLLRTARMDAGQLSRMPRLRIVARHGVGTDTVDTAFAREHGIRVTTTPEANVLSVAEHAIALLMAVRRGIGAAAAGTADRDALVGAELSGSTLGLIGYGRIARRVARIAQGGFGMRILAFDPAVPDDVVRADGSDPRALDELLAESDAVSVHVPLVPATRGLLGAAQFRRMRSHAVVVNTSRGGVVDEDALATALDAGEVGGAGLDVSEVEPMPADHPLRDRANVVVTPHIGGQTREAMRRVAMEAAASLRAELAP
ncbi:NAD(P)-dependent oxidoreductase [Microbacterium sp. KSW4-17]|uniref:NAD(P)-dependent oxidoreductase n=1 Tax=Microbacterium galbum TaxID=3075994 RepID=A0ABU3TAU0_9MICO|nr:NAD(P)-dependent oxidoreductase [Microbacterium sp. KSW4-17]MDU0368480.1 NAD(P)-dependent oxidoreductase [Microbacterium sp. KSW4-17]